MVLDLIILGVVLLLVIIGIARGIARTLLNLLSVAAAGILSYLAAGLVSNFIYSTFISPSITKSVTDAMADSTASAGTIAQEAIDGLPDFMVGAFNMFGITTDALSNSADTALNTAGATASTAVDAALKPAVTAVLSVAFIVIFFLLFLFICKRIARKAEKLFHIPVIGFVNKLLGGVLGFLEGAVICLIGIFVIRIMLLFSEQPFISDELINSSVIFSAVYNLEILNNIAEVIGIGKGAVNTAAEIASTAASELSSEISQVR